MASAFKRSITRGFVLQWFSVIFLPGLGFTGKRVARRLLARGVPVFAAARGIDRFRDLAGEGLRIAEWNDCLDRKLHIPKGATVFHPIPPLPLKESLLLHEFIQDLQPARIVYISSTGVYGEQKTVDERSAAFPADERGRARYAEERRVAEGPWASLILRAAAIYGPGRGVHMAVRQGRVPRGGGSGIVSRIHVDDLAAIAEAGLFSDLQGAWPVADETPASSAEIAAWCEEFLKLEPGAEQPGEFPVTGRIVDGRRIAELLGVRLKYPSWSSGIPASMAEEKSGSES